MAKNINKDILVSNIAEKADLSKKDVETVLDVMIEEIIKALKNGEKVTLTGFGAFRASMRKERIGINPQTKEKITIPAMTLPKFTAGKVLKEAIK